MNLTGPLVVVDLDLDFLVRGTGTLVEEPKKPVWCSADRLLEQFRRAGLLGGEIEAFLDQQASLAEWDRLDLHGAVAVHVDAHRDVYAFQSNATQHPFGIRGTVVGCGDYLFHALREGILAEVLQVVPDPICFADAARDIWRSCPEDIARQITFTRLNDLPEAVICLGLNVPPVITTVSVSPAWLPPTAWDEAERVLTLLGFSDAKRRVLYKLAAERWATLEDGLQVSDYCFPYNMRITE